MAFRNIPPNGFPAIPDIEDLEAVVKDVSTLKITTAGLAEDVSDLEEQKANQITIALPFNPKTEYEVGDLVYYNGLSYRCTNAHTGEWDADDFAGTTIANELSTLKSGLTSVDNKFKDTISIDTGTGADGFIPFIEDVLDHALSLGVGSHIFGAGRVGMYFCTVSSSVASATRAVALVVPHTFNSSEIWQCGYENGSYYVNKITATAVTN